MVCIAFNNVKKHNNENLPGSCIPVWHMSNGKKETKGSEAAVIAPMDVGTEHLVTVCQTGATLLFVVFAAV